MSKQTICLNMIVKNESRIIERCISSVKHLIDTWCIIDTGSTDGTQDIIKKLLADKPGELIERPWVNFGHNRNEALRYAEKRADWILLTDADMVLNDEGFNKELLNSNIDGYDVIQDNHGIRYYNFRLLNSKKNWQCVGVTHEYYTPAAGLGSREKLNSIWFSDISDGGSKGDKFERDIKLLTQGLVDEPENHRYMFYLAQSYRDIQHWELAIEWYLKCARESKWDEESWYADYMAGWCMRNTDRPIEVISEQLLNSWIRRPWRAETVYSLSEEFQKRKMWQQAYATAKIAASTDYPKNDVLFITAGVYEGGAIDAFAVAAYWSQHYEESIAACQKILNTEYGKIHQSRLRTNLWFSERALGYYSEDELHRFIREKKKEIENVLTETQI
jgi:glycosyltransferase involved in cell wall biosynthesis